MNVQLGTWTPDLPEFRPLSRNSLQVHECANMYRAAGRWHPVYRAQTSGQTYAQIPSDPVRGWQFTFSNGNTQTIIQGVDLHLYRYTASQTWTKLTGTAGTERWSLARFGDAIYAATGNQTLLKWTELATVFAPVSGGPVNPRIVRAVRNFLVVADLSVNGTRSQQAIRWSGLESPDEWTSGTKFSDSQTIPDLGDIVDIVSMEDAYVVCTKGIVRMSLIGGSYTWQFDTLTREAGAQAQGLSIGVNNALWLFSRQGALRVDPSGAVSPIGSAKVDRQFREIIDAGKLNLASVSWDASNHNIRWAISRGTSYPDASFIYNMETWSWGFRDDGYQVYLPYDAGNLTWADVESLFGTDIQTVGLTIQTFLDTRLAGGAELTHGFNSGRLLEPASETPEFSLTTKKFTLGDGLQRYLVRAIRPWTDGMPMVSVAAAEELSPLVGVQSFEDFTWRNETGFVPMLRSGRMFQFRFTFPSGSLASYLSGFDLDVVPDGAL